LAAVFLLVHFSASSQSGFYGLFVALVLFGWLDGGAAFLAGGASWQSIRDENEIIAA
jgi:hypothetical protein